MYCTYLTVYSGNKLPPFYIGYKKTEDVLNGYHGSVRSKAYRSIWESELKDNPQFFKTIILTNHETDAEARAKEEYFQLFFNVHKNPMYINRSINTRKFYMKESHSIATRKKIGDAHRGKSLSSESREKLSKSRQGMVFTEEHRRRIGNSKRNTILTDVHKKRISEANLGKSKSDETKAKISASHKLNSKSVTDGNVIFTSATEAASHHGVGRTTILMRIKNGTKGWRFT